MMRPRRDLPIRGAVTHTADRRATAVHRTLLRHPYLPPALTLAVVTMLVAACGSSASKTSSTTSPSANPTTTGAAAAAQSADIHLEPGRSSCPSGGTDGPAYGTVSFTSANGIVVDVSVKSAAP